MDYQLNTKNISSPKQPFHGRKLPHQKHIVEQTISPLTTTTTTTTLSPTYLTTDDTWKTATTIGSTSKLGDGQKRQEMELKNIGKVGMIKRKQFLQKRDISRSHEVNLISRKKFIFKKIERDFNDIYVDV